MAATSYEVTLSVPAAPSVSLGTEGMPQIGLGVPEGPEVTLGVGTIVSGVPYAETPNDAGGYTITVG